MTVRRAAVLAGVGALALAGCGRESPRAGAGVPRAGGAPESAGVASAPPPAAREEWDKREVIRRLGEAGLVVADSGERVRHPPLTVEGDVLHVGGGRLEVYLYPTDADRRRESAALDTATPGLPSIYNPRWVISGNLIAILRTPNDRAAERVTNTLLAFHTSDGT